jgi:hypothetical protein
VVDKEFAAALVMGTSAVLCIVMIQADYWILVLVALMSSTLVSLSILGGKDK